MADVLVIRSGNGVTLSAIKMPWFFWGGGCYSLNGHKIQLLQRYSNLKFLPADAQIHDASKIRTQTG